MQRRLRLAESAAPLGERSHSLSGRGVLETEKGPVDEATFVHEGAAGDALAVQANIPAVAERLEFGLLGSFKLGQKCVCGQSRRWRVESQGGSGGHGQQAVEEVAAEQLGMEFGIGFGPGEDVEAGDPAVDEYEEAALTGSARKALQRAIEALPVCLEGVGHRASRRA